MSCSASSGKAGNIDTNDIKYYKDKRTGLCFAIIGASKPVSIQQSESIGMACVPCENVEQYLERP